ncbi:MAG: transcription antitermination factor NusB [Pseudohongiellaceae bacterium]
MSEDAERAQDANGGVPGEKAKKTRLSERHKARRMILQALYQWHMAGAPVADIQAEFLAYYQGKIDRDYFREIFTGVVSQATRLDELMAPILDRDVGKLDPIERCLLRLGLYELSERVDVPYRVVINEAVELARVYGATDSHKYINSILDKAAGTLRAAEQRGTG